MPTRPAWRLAPLNALCLCAGLLCLSAGQNARADAPTRTLPFGPNMIPASRPTTAAIQPRNKRVLRRAHAAPHDDAGNWQNIALATASDGASFSLWNYVSTGAAGEWVYDASGNEIAIGPTYGPYADVAGDTWGPYDISVNPSTDQAQILWTRSDGAAGVWKMDVNGNQINVGPTYGPYTDSSNSLWNCIGIATANDDTSDLLWTNTGSGTMGVWVLDASGTETAIGPTYGPYTDSSGGTWQPYAISVNPHDDTARILWENTDGTVVIWIVDANGNYVSSGTGYGPYTDPNGGNWNVNAIATAIDGTSNVLWTRDDGATGVWQFDGSGDVTNVGPTYGPISDSDGTWSTIYEGLGENPTDDTTRLLFDRSDNASGIWALDTQGNETSLSDVYGPYY